MTATRIKDFVEPVLTQIKNLSPQKSCSNILLYVESQLAVEKLVCFLEKNASSDSGIFINVLRKFCDFLSERWFKIKNTDAIYPHHPETQANRAYFLLAESLGEIMHQSPYDLLMPTVGAIIHQMSRNNLSCFKFHEFILADDGTPIEVAKCLNDAAKNKTTKLFYTGLHKQQLNYNEKNRIINHSSLANKYYKEIELYEKYGTEDYKEVGEKFNDAIGQANYIVAATYGEQGQIRLAKNLLAGMKNRRVFIETLIGLVPQERWKEFISYMPTEELSTLLFNNNSFNTTLMNKRTYTESMLYNRAIMFCFVEIYWRKRAAGDRFSSIFGKLTDYTTGLLGAFTKDQKEEGVRLLQEFLMSHENLSKLIEYVKKHAKNKESYNAIFEVGSNLAIIADQIIAIADPDYLNDARQAYTLGYSSQTK